MEPHIALEETSIGQVSTMLISPVFDDALTSPSNSIFDKLLNSITRQDLTLMLINLKQNKQYFTQRLNSSFAIYEDLLVITLFKINQFQLSKQSSQLMFNHLVQVLKRPYFSIKQRFLRLKDLEFKYIYEAMLRDFDFILHIRKDQAQHWVQRWQKKHPLHISKIDVKQYPELQNVYITVFNQQRKELKSKIGFLEEKREGLGAEEAKLIIQIFERIESRAKKLQSISKMREIRKKSSKNKTHKTKDETEIDSYLEDPLSKNSRTPTYRHSFASISSKREFPEYSQTFYQASSDHYESKSIIRTQMREKPTREKKKMSNQLFFAPSPIELSKLQSEIKRLLLLFEKSPAFENAQNLEQQYTFFNHQSQEEGRITLNSALKELRKSTELVQVSRKEEIEIRRKLEVMMNIYHFQNDQYQRNLTHRFFMSDSARQRPPETEQVKDCLSQLHSFLSPHHNLFQQLGKFYERGADLKNAAFE